MKAQVSTLIDVLSPSKFGLQGGWLPGLTIRWSELSPARGLATCGMGARSARSAADAGGQLAGHPSCGRPSHRRPPAWTRAI